jgi:DNA-binding MarR family transcriptional regulator
MHHEHAPAAELLRRIAAHWPEQAERVHPEVIFLYRARDLLLDDIERMLKPLGMRTSDVDVLAALRTQPQPRQLTPTALYRALLLSSGGLTKILHRLEGAGWIARPANPRDGRSRLVSLTAAGEAQLQLAVEAIIAHEDRCMAPLSPAEQQQLGRLLGKLVAAWESQTG